MNSIEKHLLVVDDDAQIRRLLDQYLTDSGFTVSTVADGASARSTFANTAIDLILLDIVLPDIDGISLAKEFCANSDTPIIMLTVKNDEIERIVGLELGADDYVTKPFSPRELVARIKAIFRRIDSAKSMGNDISDSRTIYEFGQWVLDPTARRITRLDGEERHLTAAEFSLLNAFICHPRHVLTRDQLLGLSRPDPHTVFDRSIDYLILRLRRKLDDVPRKPRLIKTEHGVGYMLDVKVSKRSISVKHDS